MKNYYMGWLPDSPDMRDYSPDTSDVKTILKNVKSLKSAKTAKLPAHCDLSNWCSPVEDQGELGSCTANAGAGILEYFERRAFNNYIDASRLFLYKATRNILKVKGDTGANLRNVMEAMAVFGVPPEEYWPYIIAHFDNEPTSFCYAFAAAYKALIYYRLDSQGTSPSDIVKNVKNNLNSGLPSMFGFTVYSSYSQTEANGGKFPYPVHGEKTEGGHAIVAIGYDDTLSIKNTNPKGPTTKGAFKIRNSWGTTWGDKGYGWLPYEYVLKGQATDFWSLVKADWMDTGNF